MTKMQISTEGFMAKLPRLIRLQMSNYLQKMSLFSFRWKDWRTTVTLTAIFFMGQSVRVRLFSLWMAKQVSAGGLKRTEFQEHNILIQTAKRSHSIEA